MCIWYDFKPIWLRVLKENLMSNTVHIIVDGKDLNVPAGISVAAAVLGHDHSHQAFHHNTMDGSPRSPYCLMGVCFECMMEIDGVQNSQSCLIAVQEGMRVNRQLRTESLVESLTKSVTNSVNDRKQTQGK